MTSKKLNPLASLVMAGALTIGLAACGGSSTTPEPMPEPMPQPEPLPPTDLETTQAAAADAAAAAKMSADAAEASAAGAEAATMHIASLQTGPDADADGTGGLEAAMAAREHADKAMAEYMTAMAAAETAATAATGEAGEAAWRMAENAKAAAEAAATMADMYAKTAMEAAMMEVQVNGALISMGDSSVPSTMGMLTDTDDDGNKTLTGLRSNVGLTNAGSVLGRHHSAPSVTPVVGYRQAVEGRDINIGKTLDTTDDKAQVTLIDARVGMKAVRVYAHDDSTAGNNFAIRTANDSDGFKQIGAGGAVTFAALPTLATNAVAAANALSSLGMYYRATESGETGPGGAHAYLIDTANPPPAPTLTSGPLTIVADSLDASDLVQEETKGKEIFAVSLAGPDGTLGNADDVAGFAVELSRSTTVLASGLEVTDVVYQIVDIDAPAAPDGADIDGLLDLRGVTADIPMAEDYTHINFGIWAGLGEAKKPSGAQDLSGLGIGFVENISESGMTEKLGIGTATFTGDWVAVIQERNTESFAMDDGSATLVANFAKGTVKSTLAGLATLDGTLSGNAFSGTKATNITHSDLNPTGNFTGSFSGGIYGADGSEAAGVFDFAGGAAGGSFRGAFGGKEDN
jgi:hypothetical protein